MSLKYYCDVCEKPVREQSDRIRRLLGKVMIEVMVRYENTWNAGHVCEKCVLKVIAEGRPAADDESYIADSVRSRQVRAS